MTLAPLIKALSTGKSESSSAGTDGKSGKGCTGKGSFLGMELRDKKRRNRADIKVESGGFWHTLELEVGMGRAACGGTTACPAASVTGFSLGCDP